MPSRKQTVKPKKAGQAETRNMTKDKFGKNQQDKQGGGAARIRTTRTNRNKQQDRSTGKTGKKQQD